MSAAPTVQSFVLMKYSLSIKVTYMSKSEREGYMRGKQVYELS